MINMFDRDELSKIIILQLKCRTYQKDLEILTFCYHKDV